MPQTMVFSILTTWVPDCPGTEVGGGEGSGLEGEDSDAESYSSCVGFPVSPLGPNIELLRNAFCLN